MGVALRARESAGKPFDFAHGPEPAEGLSDSLLNNPLWVNNRVRTGPQSDVSNSDGVGEQQRSRSCGTARRRTGGKAGSLQPRSGQASWAQSGSAP